MTKAEFTQEFERLVETFSDTAGPRSAERVSAFYAPLVRYPAAAWHDAVDELLTHTRFPKIDHMRDACERAWDRQVSRKQAVEKAAAEDWIATVEASSDEYGALRCQLVLLMLEKDVPPGDVADVLEAAKSQYPQIEQAEIDRLRRYPDVYVPYGLTADAEVRYVQVIRAERAARRKPTPFSPVMPEAQEATQQPAGSETIP